MAYLYAGINTAGYVQRSRMLNVYAGIEELENGAKTAEIAERDSCKVFPGARTTSPSPDGGCLISTSQGSDGYGGNADDVYKVEYK